MSLKPVAQRLLAYAAPQRGRLLLSVVFFLLGSAVEPIVPWLFKKLLDSGFSAAAAFPLWVVPVVVIGLFMARGLLSFSGSYLMNSAAANVVLSLRRDLMNSLLGADARLYSTMSPGVMVNKVMNDPVNAFSSLTGALTTLLRDSTAFVFLMGYLIYLDWKLTLISMTVLPGLVFMVRRLHKRLARVGTLEYESQQRLAGVVDETARAWRVIRTFDAGEFEHERFSREAGTLRGLNIKRTTASALLTPMTQIVAAVGVSLILTLAVWQARQGLATVGEFVSFITALLMTISPMRHLTDVSQPIINGLVVAQGCFSLLDTPQEQDPGTGRLEPCRGDIRFDRVTVRYDPSAQPALNALSLDIRAGQTIALVGASGSGKTTLISALLGFVPPESGSISLDGVDIGSLTRKNLRRHFAVVSQDIVLFDGSIAQNVAYAQDSDPARIEHCLRAANLWDFVSSLPEGVATHVGNNGSRLSGGQRQRLAIARALYKNSAVWIFDEATSALDSESEQIVQQSIDHWSGDKTMILIAHRLSTVRKADRIFVLSNGGELRARSGVYAAMVAAQSHD